MSAFSVKEHIMDEKTLHHQIDQTGLSFWIKTELKLSVTLAAFAKRLMTDRQTPEDWLTGEFRKRGLILKWQ